MSCKKGIEMEVCGSLGTVGHATGYRADPHVTLPIPPESVTCSIKPDEAAGTCRVHGSLVLQRCKLKAPAVKTNAAMQLVSIRFQGGSRIH